MFEVMPSSFAIARVVAPTMSDLFPHMRRTHEAIVTETLG